MVVVPTAWEVRVDLGAVAHSVAVQLADLELLVKDIPVALPTQMGAEIPGAGAVVQVPPERRGLHLALEVLVELVYNGAMVIIMQVVVEVADLHCRRLQVVLAAEVQEPPTCLPEELLVDQTDHCILGVEVAAESELILLQLQEVKVAVAW